MEWLGKIALILGIVLVLLGFAVTPDAIAQEKKPNIVVIMGDDIGMWNIGAYHRGLMAGKTPSLDKIAKATESFVVGGADRDGGSCARSGEYHSWNRDQGG
jgi:hypothetical protein